MKGFEDEMAQTSSSNEQQETLDLYSSKFLSENSVETLLDKSILYSEFFNTSYTRCACDEQTGGNLCETYDNQIATFQVAGKKCFTLFHGTDKEEVNKFTANMDYSTAPVILSNEAHIGDAEPSQVRLHRKELIRFHINFGSNDTVALNTQSQATMLIHDNFVVPAMQTKHVIQLKPGYYYQIYIQAQETILLEPPFDSRCRNYLEGRKGTNKKLHPILDTPSSRADCMTGCLGKHTMNACKCWPPELPYVSTFNTTHENNLTLCDWKTNRFGKSSSLQQPEHRADFEHCFAQFTEGCSVKCDNDCIYVLGDTGVSVNKGDWVFSQTYAMHTNPEYFPDPMTFQPDRFLPENKHLIVAFSYTPFGEGPRQCIGMRFAQLQIKVAMARAVLRMKFSRSDKTLVPVQYVPGVSTFVPCKDIIIRGSVIQ
ncbi:Cytochrome P450 3A19 [Halotydeus destructor]|nr:Cytochrome P450 3A19 [Halotydeus destructor]